MRYNGDMISQNLQNTRFGSRALAHYSDARDIGKDGKEHGTIGCKERSDPSQGTFSHDTGEGWVQAKEGHYHDAIHNKHNSVKVMIFSTTLEAPPQAQQRPSKASPKTRRGKAPAMPQTTGKPIRNASTNTTLHRHITRMCVQGSAMSFVTGLANLERSTTKQRSE